MYAIIDNKPYAIIGDKLCEVSFGEKGTIVIGKEVDKEIEGKRYTYDEIFRKFNLRLLLQKKDDKKEEPKKIVEKPIEKPVKEEIKETTEEEIEVVEEKNDKKNK